MATAKDQVICHVCGFKNAQDAERCVSCGAKLEELSASYTGEEEAKRQDQQQGFAIRWAAASFVVFLVMQAVALAGLPAVIESYDPQGFSALMISMAIWFVGGMLIGYLSPGKTFFEPALGALLAVVPTVVWIAEITPEAPERLAGGGFQLGWMFYAVGGFIGAMLSVFGAYLGELMQQRGQKNKAAGGRRR